MRGTALPGLCVPGDRRDTEQGISLAESFRWLCCLPSRACTPGHALAFTALSSYPFLLLMELHTLSDTCSPSVLPGSCLDQPSSHLKRWILPCVR